MLLIGLRGCTKPLRKTYPLTVDLALLIYAAAVLGLRSRTYLIDKLLFVLGIEFALPRQTANLFHYVMLELNYTFVVFYHNSSVNRQIPSRPRFRLR